MKKDLFVCLLIAMLVSLCSCMSIQFVQNQKAYQPQDPQFSNIDIALVLGGGGVRGLAHVGVLEELLNAGIVPDLIVGSSAGAMVGALYADTLDIDYVKTTVLNTHLKDVMDKSFWYTPIGMASGKTLQKYLSKKLKARNFEDLKMPYIAVATNLQFGNITAFGTGPLFPAIRASSACPGAYHPVEISGQYFVDGGVSAPVPVTVARQYKPKVIISVDIKEELTETKPGNVLGFLDRCMRISLKCHSELSTDQADIVIKFSFSDIGTFNDQKNEFLYQEGKKEAIKMIPEIKKIISQKIK